MLLTVHTLPQLAVYAKLLCLLMVVICGAAAPMEEKVRLFNRHTNGFMQATNQRGALVTAKSAVFSKFNNLTIRSTDEIGVVEIVFADLRIHRRLCMDKDGKLKAVKHLKRRGPGCLFRECIDGDYFFYLTKHAKPRIVGFKGSEQHNKFGPRQCCSPERRLVCEKNGCHMMAEHLVPVPDRRGHFQCARRPVSKFDVSYFFFLKKRPENASASYSSISHHNQMVGGHNMAADARLADAASLPMSHKLSPRLQKHYHQQQQLQVAADPVRGDFSSRKEVKDSFSHKLRHQQEKQQLQRQRQQTLLQQQQQQQQQEQQLQQQQARHHKTRHHHQMQVPPRPLRVRHKNQQHTSPNHGNLLPWG